MKGTQAAQRNDFFDLFALPPGNEAGFVRIQEANTNSDLSSPARRYRAWLALALQSPEIGVWEWDIGTDTFEVSSQWTQAMGFGGPYAAPVALGGWLDLVHPDDAASCARFVSALSNDQTVGRQVEFRLRRADGSYGWYLCRGRLLDEGRAIGVLVDVTAKRETLLRMLQIERMETIGQLTSGLAHDFNNLLTVIQGNLDLLHDNLGADALNAPILEEIGTIIDRGAALTRRLLSFASQERSATGPVDPDMVVAGLLPLLSHTLGGRIVLRTDLSARRRMVDVDVRQFENAIINLAINARDAMANGGTLTLTTRAVRLTVRDVRAERDERPGAYVMVAVADTGHGMPPQVLARIFEPFFTTKADKGTGLGIPMVARFVRQAGGHIRIESVVGEGTTMRLYIPRSVAPIE